MKIEKILEIEYTSLPTEIKKKIDSDKTRMEYWSEYVGCKEENWASLNLKGLQEFHRKKKIEDDFEGDFKEFIEEYDLELDYHLVDSRVSLAGIAKIVLIK